MFSRLTSATKTTFLLSLAALLLSALLAGPGCKGTGSGFGKDVLATVEGEAITVEDLKASTAGEIPDDPEARKAALWRIINKKLAAKAAAKEGFMKDPSVIGKVEEFYNDRLPDYLMDKIEKETKVTDEELNAARGRQDFKPIVGVSLLIAPTLEEAETALAELRKGADFGKTAEKHAAMKSEPDQEISLGEGLYPAGVRAVLNRLKPGELSPIMKMEVGYAIFKLNYRKDPEQVWKAGEANVRAEIKGAKVQAERARIIDELRGSADLKLQTRKLPGGDVQYLGAVVNGVKITMDPRFFAPSADPHFAHRGMNPKTLRDALNKRINEVLLSQEARRRGLDKDPAFRKELALKTEDVLAELIAEKAKGTYDPTEKDIRDYYEKNRARFDRRTKVRISRIVLPTKEEAEATLKELKSGKDFAAVARARSIDPTSKQKGGDVGLVSYELLKEPLRSAIAGLKVGEMSGVLKTEYGYEVLKATGRVEGGPAVWSTISTSLRKRVVLNKTSERVEAFYGALASKSAVRVNEKLLAGLNK